MKKKINKIKIIIPKGATTDIENGLVFLTKQLAKKGVNVASGFLGGEYGYGAKFENETFMMHPYCWCDDEINCGWCRGEKANFLFKPTDCRIFWYKWIGRSQEQKGKLPKDWLKVCLKSLKNEHKKGKK